MLIGAAKSGKTTLAEDMLFEAGIISKGERWKSGNTALNYREVEYDGETRICDNVTYGVEGDYKINIIDTPDWRILCGIVTSSIRVCDTAVMLPYAYNGK